ncbi:MAG: FecR family protein [Verrucomicrobiales bacterium]
MKNLFLGFALICLSGAPMFSFGAPQSGKVTVAVGDVKTTPDAGVPLPVKAGQTVAVGSKITTGPGARAVVVMTPRSAIRISENSEVLIAEVDEAANPAKVLVDLKSGSLGALLKPAADSPMDFRIKTPSGVAAARGTFYSVAVKDGKGFAQVKEGVIQIIPNN